MNPSPNAETVTPNVNRLSLGAPPEPVTSSRRRLDSIDLLRGIVMVIMMLDTPHP